MHIRSLVIGAAAVVALSAPASAQVIHGVQFGGGLFAPKGVDSRVAGDVLVRNYVGQPVRGFPSLTDALDFEIGDFRAGQVFGEWTIGFGDRVEVALGVGHFAKSVNSVYFDLVDDFDRDIAQTMRLRVTPMTAVVRFMPFGNAGDVQPYIGGGVAALAFRYAEFGRFVDNATLDIFEDRFEASGTVPGGVVLGGLKLPLGGDVYGMSIEGRYLIGAGDTGGINAGFLDDKIDLGGFLLNVGFQVRF